MGAPVFFLFVVVEKTLVLPSVSLQRRYITELVHHRLPASLQRIVPSIDTPTPPVHNCHAQSRVLRCQSWQEPRDIQYTTFVHFLISRCLLVIEKPAESRRTAKPENHVQIKPGLPSGHSPGVECQQHPRLRQRPNSQPSASQSQTHKLSLVE